MTYPVKFMNHKFHGAPTLAPTLTYSSAASAFFKAALVDGFGLITVDSVEWDAATGWAKATYSTGHTYQKHQVIEVAGASIADYNGEHRVKQVTTTEIWFELDAVPGGNPTGAITLKTPGLGWSVNCENADGTVVIYEAAGDEGNVLLRIDNSDTAELVHSSYGHYVNVSMVENVVDVDSYDEIYSAVWPASHAYSDQEWSLVGDNKLFWFFPAFAATYNEPGTPFRVRGAYIAGYINSIRPGDRYHFVLNQGDSSIRKNSDAWSNYSYNSWTSLLRFNYKDYNYIARAHSQLAGAVKWQWRSIWPVMGFGQHYPNPADNSWYLEDRLHPLFEGDVSIDSDGYAFSTDTALPVLRGYLPGVLNPQCSPEALIDTVLDDLYDAPHSLIYFTNGSHHYDGQSADGLIGRRQSLVGFDITRNGWR